MKIKKLLANPYFLIGLGIRLLLIVLAVPLIRSQWFIPFLQAQLQHFSLNPWQNYLAINGDPKAFPYGTIMYLVFLPGAVFGKILTAFWPYVNFTSIGIGLVTLILDFCLMNFLQKITEAKCAKIINYY